MITTSNLQKSFFIEQAEDRIIYSLDLEIEDGEFVSIIGPSGCGKTTLLRLLAGLERPTAGKVSVNGMTPAEALSRRSLTFLAQLPALLPWRTALGNLRLVHEVGPKSLSGHQHVDEKATLDAVGLDGFTDVYPSELSGGMKSRLAFARALLLKPEILMMDEPFSSLDELTREALNHMLSEIQRKQALTSVLVTHSLREAIYLSDRIVAFPQKRSTELLYFDVQRQGDWDYDSENVSKELLRLKTELARVGNEFTA
ncbi:MAG: ABC transporter ATP-binding protein [Alphaproteobacteria bacterium]